MILPIIAYGNPVLRKKCKNISHDYIKLNELISNMWDTMYASSGVGLAAPQIGLSIRLFLVDTVQAMEEGDEAKGIKKAFINAQILEEGGEPWTYEEGCLSIPGIRADVYRPDTLVIRYLDTDFVEYTEEYSGLAARIIQHEYDHIDGKIFIERVSSMRKITLRRRLSDITDGKINPGYRMIFPNLKKGRR